MNYKIAAHTLQGLLEEIGQTATITLTIRTQQDEPLKFSLDVERSPSLILFSLTIADQRHTLTLPDDKCIAQQLAAFVEEITNGFVGASTDVLPLATDLPIADAAGWS